MTPGAIAYRIGDTLRSTIRSLIGRAAAGGAAPQLAAGSTWRYDDAGAATADWPLAGRHSAIYYATLSRCVTLISATVAQMITGGGLRVVDSDGRRSTSSRARQVLRLLSTSVDGGVTPAHTWVEDAVIDYGLDGNALLIPRHVGGELQSIRRMLPWDAELIGGPPPVYRVHHDPASPVEHVAAADVIHIRWPMLQQSSGLGLVSPRPGFALAPVVALGRALRIGIEGDRYIEDWFGRGVRSRLHIDYPPRDPVRPLTDEQREQIRRDIARWSTRREPLVTFGGESHEIRDSPQDQSARALREYQVADVARLFGVPAPLLGVDVTQWGQGIQQLAVLYWRFGGRQHLERFLAPLQVRLLEPGDRFVPDTSDLLRGDAQAMARLLQVLQGDAQRAPIATREELRRLAGLPADPEGDFAAPGGDAGGEPQPAPPPRRWPADLATGGGGNGVSSRRHG